VPRPSFAWAGIFLVGDTESVLSLRKGLGPQASLHLVDIHPPAQAELGRDTLQISASTAPGARESLGPGE
jgi:hypothetical protein